MRISKATVNDLDALAELFDLYRVFYQQKSDLAAAREFLQARLMNGESVVFIAYDGDMPVGFTQLYPLFTSIGMGRTWVLNDLYVHEAARKQGHGKRLLERAIAFADEAGAKGILLETGKENKPAQRLYEQIGFVEEENLFYFYTI